MKKTMILFGALFLTVSAQASILQTRLATKMSVRMENGKWRKAPMILNVSSLVYRQSGDLSPLRCRIDTGEGRLGRLLTHGYNDSLSDPCVKIPGTDRIVISTEGLESFAIANAGAVLFGSERVEDRVLEIFRSGIVVRVGGEDQTPSRKLLSLANTVLGNGTGIHTLNLSDRNAFTVKTIDGTEMLRLEILTRDTKVLADDEFDF